MGRLLLLVIVAGSTVPAFADPLFQTLPEDGTGAKFHVNMVLNGKDQARHWKTLSVGRRMVDGQPARWIELHGEAYDQGVIKYRLLIPEAEFGPGKHPLSKAVETWQRINDEEPRRIDSLQNDLFLYTLLSGPGDGKKLADKEPVEWQKGRFNCDVVEGSSQIKLGPFDVAIKHRSYYHEDAPFGFAGTRQEFQRTVGGNTDKAILDARLVEILKDTTSGFPGE